VHIVQSLDAKKQNRNDRQFETLVSKSFHSGLKISEKEMEKKKFLKKRSKIKSSADAQSNLDPLLTILH
jgi:hypothetical protein